MTRVRLMMTVINTSKRMCFIHESNNNRHILMYSVRKIQADDNLRPCRYWTANSELLHMRQSEQSEQHTSHSITAISTWVTGQRTSTHNPYDPS